MSISITDKRMHDQVVLDAKRLAALYQTKLLDSEQDNDFDRLTEFTCKLLRTTFAFITLIDSDRHFFLSMYAATGPIEGERSASPMYSFCQNVVVTNKRHAINNVHDGGLVCKAEAHNSMGIVAYLGTPLRTPDNQRIGSLCVIEDRARTWTLEDKQLIKEAGELVVKEIALRYYANEHSRAERDIATHIAALKEVNGTLEQRNKELSKANAVKDDFLATMSHEIRTPMNGVIGFTSLLLETALNPLQREYTETIRSSGEALLDIINDILDFSAISSGKIQLSQFPFSVHACLSDALDVISLKASSKNLEIGYVVDRTVPELLVGDVRRIGQILVNLLGNAVKFTEKGQIGIHTFVDNTVHVKKGSVALHIIVSDTGIGIPKDKFENIFQSFSQVDTSDSRRYGGTGLGLAICKELCTRMGGDIWVESEEGAGSSFHVVLELVVATPGDNTSQPSYQIRNKQLLVSTVSDICKKQLHNLCERLNNKLHFVASNSELPDLLATNKESYNAILLDLDMADGSTDMLLDMAQTWSQHTGVILLQRLGTQHKVSLPFAPMILNKPVKRALFYSVLEHSIQAYARQVDPGNYIRPSENGVQGFRILVAEDNTINSQLIMRYIEVLGHKGDTVTNGLDVIHALEKKRYDLVLMDINMPEYDGIETAQRIRSNESTWGDIYIIGITASIKKDIPHRCISAGMNDFISKPLLLHDLQKALDKVPKNA